MLFAEDKETAMDFAFCISILISIAILMRILVCDCITISKAINSNSCNVRQMRKNIENETKMKMITTYCNANVHHIFAPDQKEAEKTKGKKLARSIAMKETTNCNKKMRLFQTTSNIGLRGLITTNYAATNGIIHTNNFDIFQKHGKIVAITFGCAQP